jgi:hypothetical protein
MNTRYIIRIHSFVDLITNSSTELFISASQHTLDGVKSIINAVLKMGESRLTADDLFTFELAKDEDSYGDYGDKMTLTVKSNNPESPEGKAAAKVLSNLTGLFTIDAEYNG